MMEHIKKKFSKPLMRKKTSYQKERLEEIQAIESDESSNSFSSDSTPNETPITANLLELDFKQMEKNTAALHLRKYSSPMPSPGRSPGGSRVQM